MASPQNRKLACITGATAGVGRAVAIGLAALGYDLILIARNPDKAKKLEQEIRTAHPQTQITFVSSDLTLVADAKKAGEFIRETFSCLDLLFQSAGIIPRSFVLTKEGIEQSFAVSFLTRLVLIRELLPLLLESADKLLLTVASPQPGNYPIRFEDINFQTTKFSSYATVRQFQEANDVLAVELRSVSGPAGLRNYCFNPGIVNTGIHDGWPPLIRFFLTKIVGAFLMIEPEQSAQMILGFVSGSNLEAGPLITSRGRTIDPPARVLDSSYRKKLFEVCDALIAKAA